MAQTASRTHCGLLFMPAPALYPGHVVPPSVLRQSISFPPPPPHTLLIAISVRRLIRRYKWIRLLLVVHARIILSLPPPPVGLLADGDHRDLAVLERAGLDIAPGSRTPQVPNASRLIDAPGIAFRLSQRVGILNPISFGTQ
jgi:hypothetical protein